MFLNFFLIPVLKVLLIEYGRPLALNNTVAYLKNINFLRLTLPEKLDIKEKGRHCPDIAVQS